MTNETEPSRYGASPMALALSVLAIAAFAGTAPSALARGKPPPEETDQPEQAEPEESLEQPAPPEQAESEEAPEQAEAAEALEPESSATAPPAAAAATPAPERRSISTAELNRGQIVQIGDAPDDRTALSIWRATGPRIGTYAVGSIAGRPVAIGADGEIRSVAAGPVQRSGPVQRPPSRPPSR